MAAFQKASIPAEPLLAQPPPCAPNIPSSFMHTSQSLTMALTVSTGSNINSVYPLPSSIEPASCLSRIKLADILPEDGAESPEYINAVEELWGCLAHHGAAIVEVSAEDAALVRCALESAKLYFRTRVSGSTCSAPVSLPRSKFVGYTASGSKETYNYRAGRNLLGEAEQPPPCMSDVYRCLGKASRVALGAICRQLQLRSDVFSSLLDDCPLPRDDTSSSVLLATQFRCPVPSVNGTQNVDGSPHEIEKGLITLIASDSPGLQVCDTNGLWYLADIGLRAGDLLLLTGRALQHITAGLCKAGTYRVMPLSSSNVPGSSKRLSIMFRLMPRGGALLDGSAMAEAGHVVSEGYGAVVFSKYLAGLSIHESADGTKTEKSERKRYLSADSALRSLLCDPMTGNLLDDAFTATSCGHTFGGGTLQRVREMQSCSSCGAAVSAESLVPNLVLRAVAVAFDEEEKRRRLQVASRKRRKELREQRERKKRLKESKTPRKSFENSEQGKGVQYPFNINEKVFIKGNKRTPEKLVGREAFVTSKCLNGWYLLKLVDNGESVRLQYRSLEGAAGGDGGGEGAASESTQNQSAEPAES